MTPPALQNAGIHCIYRHQFQSKQIWYKVKTNTISDKTALDTVIIKLISP